MGAPKLDTYLFDGSGLSRYNLIQPHKLNANIQSLIQHHAWIKKYMLTEKNLKITMPSNTHLYYKTGTLFPVKNIAGLIERPNHPPLFFTLTCTHPKSKVCQQAHKDKIKDLANLYIKN
jgi:D-alanyl-D-alanine carboxypeptidase